MRLLQQRALYYGYLYIIGKKLREGREAKGFSQAELARQIKSHHSIVGKYERDEVKPTIDVVKKLADVLYTTAGFCWEKQRTGNF